MSLLTKRLAGPAFYVNVKFDQNNAKKQKNASVAITRNSRHFYHIVHDNELFDIKEGEILYSYIRNHSRDGFARVLSTLNGHNTITSIYSIL
jgi:hypothetical protein